VAESAGVAEWGVGIAEAHTRPVTEVLVPEHKQLLLEVGAALHSAVRHARRTTRRTLPP
jgi:hypothetical protein